MSSQDSAPAAMRTVRFHAYGDPADVLRLEETAVPAPAPGRILVAVHACGLAPADWALCRGLFPGQLPRGIGCDVSGTVRAVGDGVTDVAVGDRVFGTADWARCPSAGVADYAVMDHWFGVPDGLGLTEAAALPMALDTAYLHLTALGLTPGRTILIHGAGGTVGFAAVQIALIRGLRVIATAGDTYAERLRGLGAAVTSYGPGLVERVGKLTDGPVDLALDTAPVGGALPDLIELAGGDPRLVLTISDLEAAQRLGARDTFHEDRALLGHRFAAFPEFARLAADGQFAVPIAATFPLDDWRTAMDLSLTGHPRGKLLLLPRP